MRIDNFTFVDNVCWAKTKELLLPGPKHRSCVVRDSAIVMNSTTIATICKDPGYVRPAEPVYDVAKSSIAVVYRCELQPPSTCCAIAAGSNLVRSSDSNASTSFIDIPLYDFYVNI